MIPPDAPAEKRAALRRHHALNPRPQRVRDPAFLGENAFFDRSDLVQVKYEMLRRVREDGQPVSEASAAFGFSRPSFYQAQAAFQEEGLPGLLPERPGPKRAHKLSETVLDLLEEALAEEPSLPSAALVRLLEERLGLSVHPRSVERALKRRRKKGGSRDALKTTAPAAELLEGYEALRAQALGELPSLTPRGLAVFVRGGLASWMSACPPRERPRPVASPRPGGGEICALTAGSAELVRLLAGMALSSQRRCPL